MDLKQEIMKVLEELPEAQQRQALDFARFIAEAHEQEQWRNFGMNALARAYGPDEPDYTEANIKPETPVAR